jgi:molybdopterin molybdotransferase
MSLYLTYDEAWDRISQLARSVRIETIPVASAHNRVLAVDAVATINNPPFPRSMMDGFAIRAEHAVPGISMEIVGMIAAGDKAANTLQAGQAVRIMTGARMPEMADSVARYEWCEEAEGFVTLLRSVTKGESVQQVGDDAAKGEVLVAAGTRLTGTHLAVCKCFGIESVQVKCSPAVSIIVTGSELVEEVTTPLQTGQIYGVNDVFIRHAVERDGYRVIDVQYVGDSKESIRVAILEASYYSDYVLVTGGVSVGDLDYVPQVLRDLGAELAVRKIYIRPGSPFVAASLNDAVIFGLSGNPAACYIQFETLVRPVLLRSLGIDEIPFSSSGRLAHDIELKPIKPERIFRARAWIESGAVQVDARSAQSPGVMSSLSSCNCLIRLDKPDYTQGSVIQLRWLSAPHTLTET